MAGKNKTVKITGQNIREIREKKGLTQEQVAKKAQLNVSHYGKIERGERSTSIDSYELIVKALSVRSNDIFPF